MTYYMFEFVILVAMAILRCVYCGPYPIAHPGCPEKCGNVSIYYPFGIGEGCFKDKWFEITCNSSSTPILVSYKLQVSKISFHQVWVTYNWTSPSCHPDESGLEMLLKPHIPTTGTYNPFLFSNRRNKLVGFGCGVVTYVTSKSAPNYSNYTKGCISLCNNHTGLGLGLPRHVFSQNCLGIGCCQATIPPGLKSISLRIFNVGNENKSLGSKPTPCSRALIVDDGVKIRDLGDHEVPMVMTWVIGNATCDQLHSNSESNDFTCGKNARCISHVRTGHRCECNEGYEGNPYISDGCQDVDECKNNPRRCFGGAICKNTIGGFYCSCPAGKNITKPYETCVLIGEIPPPPKAINTFRTIMLGLGTAMAILSSAVTSIWCWWMLKRKRQADLRKAFFKRNGGLLLQQQVNSQDVVVKTQIFSIDELEKATDNFNRNRICGKGGCGSVYKAMLSDGRIVAIKKSHIMHEKHVSHFINEVVILSRINHRNVVKLLGCCLETEVPLLVYEFIGNGTLSHHTALPWEVRVSIAREIAGSLSYLHSSLSTPVFHRDVKSSNILLDYNFNAKISDFGISRSIPMEKTHLTLTLQGTFGYIDPQYFRSKQFTDKSDVYSFGVVLVELLTGEKAMSNSKIKSEVEEKSLVVQFTTAMKEDRLFDVVEDRVRHEGRKEEIIEFARLAKQCIKLNGKKRPTMKEVASDLEKISIQVAKSS